MIATQKTGRLLLPDVRCPACHTAPRLRITEEERERYLGDPPDREVATYRCHRRISGRECGTVYWITVRAYQRSA